MKDRESSNDVINSLQINHEEAEQSVKIMKEKIKALEDSGLKMREEMRKISEKYETKYLLIQRMVSGKLMSLKKDHEKMKKNIHKEMLAFFKLTKMIFINK